MLTNGRLVKLLWANVGLSRAGKALVIMQGRRVGNGSWNVLFDIYCQLVCLVSRFIANCQSVVWNVPRSIANPPPLHNHQSLSCSCKANICPQQFHESAIGQHLLDNAQCALHYNNDKFSILTQDCSSFHLSALEVTFIKLLNPFLCKQKEFVYFLKIS